QEPIVLQCCTSVVTPGLAPGGAREQLCVSICRVDRIGLQHQVEEKKKKVESEKDSLNALAADMVRNDRAACILDSRQRKEERALQQNLDGYRLSFQQPQQRREHDLSDPGHPRAPAGLQMMTLPGLLGEDPGSEARLRRQQEQLWEWTRQQQAELGAGRHQQELAAETRERRRRAAERSVGEQHRADALRHLQADREQDASQSSTLQAARQRAQFNLHQVEEQR
ncbi:hypothetical protein CRUP_037952, partial [Coryphaenoides rupestris]